MMSLLGSEGLINEVLLKLGVIDKSVNFLSNPDYFWGLLTTANIWKGLGWSAIIYISAIAGVDQELYQAGAVDGLGRFGKVWHITISKYYANGSSLVYTWYRKYSECWI